LKFLSDEYLECGIRTISMWGYLIYLKIFMLILFYLFLRTIYHQVGQQFFYDFISYVKPCKN
jgi:hypothetical protein